MRSVLGPEGFELFFGQLAAGAWGKHRGILGGSNHQPAVGQLGVEDPIAREIAAEFDQLGIAIGDGSGYRHRYTCPSYEIERSSDSDGARSAFTVPGFQPLAAYEVAIANLCPSAERRADPADVEEVLAWAGDALATAEVAAVCVIELEDARERLGRVAAEEHIGSDGLWRLNGV